jgi:hypothetical protein
LAESRTVVCSHLNKLGEPVSPFLTGITTISHSIVKHDADNKEEKDKKFSENTVAPRRWLSNKQNVRIFSEISEVALRKGVGIRNEHRCDVPHWAECQICRWFSF